MVQKFWAGHELDFESLMENDLFQVVLIAIDLLDSEVVKTCKVNAAKEWSNFSNVVRTFDEKGPYRDSKKFWKIYLDLKEMVLESLN